MATLEKLEKQVNDLQTIVYQILKSLEEHPRESSRILIKSDYKTNIDSLKTTIEKI
jgi:hypothetical protein